MNERNICRLLSLESRKNPDNEKHRHYIVRKKKTYEEKNVCQMSNKQFVFFKAV